MSRQTRSRTTIKEEVIAEAPPVDMVIPSRAINAAGNITATAARVTKVNTKRRTAPSSAIVEINGNTESPAKKPRTAAKPTKVAPPIPPVTPVRPTQSSPYTPILLPPTLTFSLPEAISHLTTHDPRFGVFFSQIPCKPFQPPLEAIDPFKTLVTSIIGQQVSWMAARAINKRFKALFGYIGGSEGEEDGADVGFPSPGEVARQDVMTLKGVGLSTRKAEYVICLAKHFEDGRLSAELLRDGTDEEISKALIAVRGIGQWTVDMFLMFSLRRPDILPVGDLGVQKGLLRWILAAYGALPKSKAGKGAQEAKKKYGLDKTPSTVLDKVEENGDGEIDTMVAETNRSTPPPQNRDGLPPTPLTPNNTTQPHLAILHTPGAPHPTIPGTPITPGPSSGLKPVEAFETTAKELPPPAPENLLSPPANTPFEPKTVVPLPEGLTVEGIKARLGGKKVKGGAYLTPKEMEELTEGWRPYRSLGVYYMWPAGEEM